MLLVIFSRSFVEVHGAEFKIKMKLIAVLALCLAAVAEAGIASPLFYPNDLVFPLELRKVVSYPSKPVFTQILKPNFFGGLQLYTVPLVGPQVPLYIVPASPQTLVANARASSDAGVAGSSVVAQSDEAVPYSVVANAGPRAAYSSAVLHPSGKGIPTTAGAYASVNGK